MVYLDTSALAKRYLPEANSDRFEAWFTANVPAAISRLTFVEMRSTLARKRRERAITADREQAALSELRTDLQDGLLVVEPGSDAHFVEAFHMIERLSDLPLRTLDALHLAIAALGEAKRIATADDVMRRAAVALQLEVVYFGT